MEQVKLRKMFKSGRVADTDYVGLVDKDGNVYMQGMSLKPSTLTVKGKETEVLFNVVLGGYFLLGDSIREDEDFYLVISFRQFSTKGIVTVERSLKVEKITESRNTVTLDTNHGIVVMNKREYEASVKYTESLSRVRLEELISEEVIWASKSKIQEDSIIIAGEEIVGHFGDIYETKSGKRFKILQE